MNEDPSVKTNPEQETLPAASQRTVGRCGDLEHAYGYSDEEAQFDSEGAFVIDPQTGKKLRPKPYHRLNLKKSDGTVIRFGPGVSQSDQQAADITESDGFSLDRKQES
jgi:hypothetical protein